MALILPRRNLLAYPAGITAGIDPSHPAIPAAVLSAVASGNGFINLLSGSKGTVNGAGISGVMDGRIGPSVNIGGNGNISFAGTNGGKSTLTMAAIFNLTGLSASPAYVINDSAVGVNGIGYNLTIPNNFLGYIQNNLFGTNAILQNVPVAVGIPYFLAMSSKGTTSGIVVRRLDTGQTWAYSSTSTSSPAVGDGSLYIGNRGTNSRQLLGSVSAVLYSTGFLTLPQLVAWAADPWSFWYPDRSPRLTGAIIASNIGGARVREWNRNALTYPAGVAPGFDPNHVASPKLSGPGGMLSAVPSGGNFVEITTGLPATVVGTTNAANLGILGPVMARGASAGCHFPNKPTAIGNKYTFGGIFQATSFGTTAFVVGNSLSGTGGGELRLSSGVLTLNVNGGTNTSSGFPACLINTPYFAAVTVNGLVSSFVLVNLATGQIWSSTVTGVSSPVVTGSGTWAIFDTPSGTNQIVGYVAAAMVTLEHVGLSGLLKWAADPWAFWYPKKQVTLTSGGANIFNQIVSVVGSTITSWLKSVATNVSVASTGATSWLKSAAKTIVATSTGSTVWTAIKVRIVNVTVACSGAVSLLKSVGKNTSLTSITSTLWIKSVGKLIAATATGTTLATAIKVKLVTIAAGCVSAVSWLKSVGKNAPVTSTTSTIWQKTVGKIASITSTGAVTAAKRITKTIVAACAGAVTVAAIKVKIVIISAASTTAATFARLIGKGVTVTSLSATTTAKAVNKALAISSSSAVSFLKSVGKLVSATASTIVAIGQSIGTGGHFVYNVVISATSTTFTQWLGGFFKKAGPESVSRTDNAEASQRSSDWPSTPRN